MPSARAFSRARGVAPRAAPSTSRPPALAAAATVRSVTAPRSIARGARRRAAVAPSVNRTRPARIASRSARREEVADEAVEVVVAGRRHAAPTPPAGASQVDGRCTAATGGGGTCGVDAVPVRPGQRLGQQLAEDVARVVAHPTSSRASVAASEAARTSDSSPVM